MKINIRIIYLYLFSAIGLVMLVIACVNLIDLGLRTYIFTKADNAYYYARVEPLQKDETSEINEEEQRELEREQAQAQNQREVSQAMAMILVGAPLYLYHWKTIKKRD